MASTEKKPENSVRLGKRQGRKTVSLNLGVLGALSPQDIIWQLVRQLRQFTTAELELAAVRHFKGQSGGMNNSTIKSYLLRLQRGGYLEKDQYRINGRCWQCRWTLVRDAGRETPKLNKQGQPSRVGQVNEQLWRAIKVIGEFSYIELTAAASTEDVSVSVNTTKSYIHFLYRFGYLVLVRRAKPGTPARYRKVPRRCEGLPPKVLRDKTVFDQNLMEIVEPIR